MAVINDHLRLQINTFGGLDIQLDGRPLTGLASRKAEALLVYLAANPRPHPREVLAELLWDELPQRRAMTNLRVALTSLRKQLDGFLSISREHLAFKPETDAWLDKHAFEQLLINSHADEPEGLITPEIALSTAQAVDLYHGEFLQGFFLKGASGFEDWTTRERERLHRLARNSLFELSAYALNTAAPKAALAHTSRLLELDTLMEAAHRQMMLVLAHAGQREDALAQFERCRGLLETELGVAPSLETLALFEQLQAGRLPDPPKAVRVLSREPRQVGESPYRGLAAFLEADAPFFFGREAFTERLLDTLQAHNLVTVVVGPSGSGKSSTVFAGLLPKLRERGHWLVVAYRPGPDPFQALARSLHPLLNPDLPEAEALVQARKLGDVLAAGDIRLEDVATRLLQRHNPGTRLLLIGDQFEELFTLCHDVTLRRDFLNELLAASQAARHERIPSLLLLQTLRADFMGQALAHRPLADALEGASVMLGPMTRGELRAAIEKPAEIQGAAFETGLVERILEDVGSEPGQLPLLEFALTLLWERLDHGWLTHAAYDEIGQVAGALAQYAEEVYGELDENERAQASRVFVQLVQPGEGTEDTRRLATKDDVGEENWGLVQHLADRRLVVTGQDAEGRQTVEVVHEALIRGWNRLGEWMAADRDFRVWQEGLRAAIRNWQASSLDKGGLLRGAPLAQAESWQLERTADLSPVEVEYIQTSIELRERREAEREQRRRRVIYGLGAGLVVALILSVFAFSQRSAAVAESRSRATQQALAESEAAARATAQSIAEEQRSLAEAETEERAQQQLLAEEQARVSFSRELAAAAITSLETDPELSILLALQALSNTHTLEAESALHHAVQNSPVRKTLRFIQTGTADHFTFSPNGKEIFVSGQGGGALWDISRGQLIFERIVPGDDWINLAAFSPDGNLLLLPRETYDPDLVDDDGDLIPLPGQVTIINAHTGEEVFSFLAHDSFVYEIRVSPDGKFFATNSLDFTAKIWDLEATLEEGAGKLVHTLNCLRNWCETPSFSPSGTRLATITEGYASVWEVNTGEELLRLGPEVYSVAYSPDEKYLVVASVEGTLEVRDALTGERLVAPLFAAGDFIQDISFSPDGSLIATGHLSGQVILWHFSPTSMRQIRTLFGHTDQVWRVEFSPDGKELYTGSLDGTMRIWDISPTGSSEIFALAADHQIRDAGFVEDGEKLVTITNDGRLRVWDTETWIEVTDLQVQDTLLNSMTVNPDGQLIATAGEDGLVKIIETQNWQEVLQLEAHAVDAGHAFFDGAKDVVFSPDGNKLATGGVDRNVILWNIQTGDQILNLTAPAWVTRVAISPDGRFIAFPGNETSLIWNASTGQVLQTIAPDDWLSPANQSFWSLDFSPDSTRMALGRMDGIFEVWKLPEGSWETGDQEARLLYKGQSAADFLLALRFSPDGEHIILSGTSGTVELRDAENGELQISLPYPGGVWELDLTKDGKRLAMVGVDGSIQVVALELEELISLARSRVTRSLTTEECQTYLRLDECPADT